MSKTYTVNFQNHLARSASRLATCMRIQRRDGNVYGFTTNRRTLFIGGLRYVPAASFNPTDIQSNNNLDTDNLTIEALLDSATITEDDLRAGKWDYAAYRIFQVNWSDLTQGDKKDRAGHLGQVTVNRLSFVAEMLGLMEAYSTSIGWITQPGCRNRFMDTKCGIVEGSPGPGVLIVTGTVDLCETDFFTHTDAARTEPDAWFDEGEITFTSGQASGMSFEVKVYVLVGLGGAPTWVTKVPVPYDTTGDSYSMVRGCRKRFTEDCVGTYANGRRFNGEPWLRGADVLGQPGRS